MGAPALRGGGVPAEGGDGDAGGPTWRSCGSWQVEEVWAPYKLRGWNGPIGLWFYSLSPLYKPLCTPPVPSLYHLSITPILPFFSVHPPRPTLYPPVRLDLPFIPALPPRPQFTPPVTLCLVTPCPPMPPPATVCPHSPVLFPLQFGVNPPEFGVGMWLPWQQPGTPGCAEPPPTAEPQPRRDH